MRFASNRHRGRCQNCRCDLPPKAGVYIAGRLLCNACSVPVLNAARGTALPCPGCDKPIVSGASIHTDPATGRAWHRRPCWDARMAQSVAAERGGP